MDNRKLLFYGGGALILGAVTFFVWSFFQKPVINLGETSVALGDNEKNDTPEKSETTIEEETSTNNPFTEFVNVQFPEFQAQVPDIESNITDILRGNK